MSTTTSSLTKFSVRPLEATPNTTVALQQSPDQSPAVHSVKRRGSARRVGIAVRLGHEDWVRLHDLAVRERASLQGLIVAGLSELMKQRGLPPLSGQ